jgi:RNA polymerase sigma-70 factor (ECF subfamily)
MAISQSATGELVFDRPLAADRPARRESMLSRRLRRGDRDAVRQLVQDHRAAVYGFLRARLVDPADADDLCQEVFLRCVAGKVRIPAASATRPWLLGVARNALREHVRKVRRRKEVGWTELCLELDALTTEAEPLPESTPREESAVQACLDSLGKSAREALDMKYGSGLTLAAIGARLCRSEGAVKLLMYRARQAVRRCLDRRRAAG